MYLCTLLCLKYVLLPQSPLSSQNCNTLLPLSFSPGTPKAPVMPSLVLSAIHPFRSPRMHNLYPFPTLSRVLSMSFQNLFFTISFIGVIHHHHTNQILTLKTLNLIHGILELTHPKFITALCHILLKRMVTPSLALFSS